VIVLGVLKLIEAVVGGLLGFIPTPSMPDLSAAVSSITGSTVFSHIAWMNGYVPLDAVLTTAGAVLTVWGVAWLFRASMWILEKVHLVGGSD
jgi:hypothetical protein